MIPLNINYSDYLERYAPIIFRKRLVLKFLLRFIDMLVGEHSF